MPLGIHQICAAPLGLYAVYWNDTEQTHWEEPVCALALITRRIYQDDEQHDIVGLVCIEGTISCCDEQANFCGLRAQETDMETFVRNTCNHVVPQPNEVDGIEPPHDEFSHPIPGDPDDEILA